MKRRLRYLPLYFLYASPLIRLAVVLVFGLLVLPSFAQAPIRSTTILEQHTTNTQLPYQNSLDYLNSNAQKMPRVNKLEFRFETDEFDWKQQEYLFRTSFNPKKEIQLNSDLSKNQRNIYSIQQRAFLHQTLQLAYADLARWYFLETQLRFLSEEKILLEDKKRIYQKKMASAVDFDLSDWLKNQEALQSTTHNILKANQEKDRLVKSLLGATSRTQLQTEGWISIQQIDSITTQLKPAYANPSIALQEAKIQTANINTQIEQAQGKQLLDFVQLKYSEEEDLGLFREFSIGLGLNIPTKSSNRLKINESMLDWHDAQSKKALLLHRLQTSFTAQKEKLKDLIEEYKWLKEKTAAQELELLYDRYLKTPDADPLTLLDIKERVLKNQYALLNLEEVIYTAFLDLLDLSGLLSIMPLKNYLSTELSIFKQ